ncbi:MAG: hypothetical protein MPK75_06555 [Alphaproteobacteria bacterium]|nr:hypothetical protein [Alphaproteobacteria bacterium]
MQENAFVAEQEVFLPVNIETEEKQLPDKGKESGSQNLPRAQATKPDAVEAGIVADVTRTAQQTKNALSGHFDSFNQRLLNIVATVEPRALIERITAVSRAAKEDLSAMLDKFKNESVIRRSEWHSAQKEYDKFKESNQLGRDADYLAPRSCVGWFAGIIVVESVLNATLLWELTGFLPAVGQTMLITAVNVLFLASLAGLLLRYKNHVSRSARRLVWACIPVFPMVFAFNLGVGHYRDALVEARARSAQLYSDDDVFDDIDFVDHTQKALESIIQSPFGIDSVLSILLILVGLGFFSFAAHKWYSMFDRYPGYRKCDLARKEKHENYRRLVETTRGKITSRVKGANDQVADERTKLMHMREEHKDLSNRAKTLQNSYANWIVALAKQQDFLVRLYRDHNLRARSEPEPKYFEDDVPQIADTLATPPDFSPSASVDDVERVVEAVESTGAEMQKISEDISREFNGLADMQFAPDA